MNVKKVAPSIGFREEKIIRWFGERVSRILCKSFSWLGGLNEVEEIRLRINQPLIVRTGKSEFFLTPSGQNGLRENAYIVKKDDLIEALERMTNSSLYAAEEELRNGFLTLPGGHRVGITGETLVEHGSIRTLRNISALNTRIANEQNSNLTSLLSALLNKQERFCHTLVVSPPRAGKTTLLRQLIKSLSDGIPKISLAGQTVGVVDERSEIAGMWQGIPSFDLGCRTDILDRCPKAQGISMLIRSMSPAVIAVDELGSPDDAVAVRDAVRCGVRILATAHAGSLEELTHRAYMQGLLKDNTFERIVVLSRSKGPGTIESIHDGITGSDLWPSSNRINIKMKAYKSN